MIDPMRAFLATAREAKAQETAEAAAQAVHAHGGMNYWEVVTGSGPIVGGVLLLLLVASVFSWALIVKKSIQLRRARTASVDFLEAFWQSKRLDAIYQTAESLPDSPVAQVFKAGYVELTKLSKEGERRSDDDLESVHRAMRRSSVAELTHLESGCSYLATIGSTAPFVGLFGTVVGILLAFHAIAQMGSASLDTVSGPIAEALIATAAGLFAAIPAVVAFNQFVARIRILESEMDNFSSDFLNIVKRHFFKPGASATGEKRATGT